MERLRFRGPDAEGTWMNERVFLGHTRLAILDPGNGRQPWSDPDHGGILVYNGEIYNHRELRGALEARGWAFRTECDTEVLWYAYREWGESCLSRLRGIFAFAIMDPHLGKLWLVRDRLGVKPLYYHASKEGFAFASSLSAIHGLRKEAPRWAAGPLMHYLMTARPELGRETLFDSIYNLEPGTFLTLDIDSGTYSTERYWSLPRIAGKDKRDGDEASIRQEVLNLLGSSFREQHLSSDVPVGAFLSGGIDSAILSSSVQSEGAALTAYSIGYERENYNEWEAMSRTARRCGLNWKQVTATEAGFWEDCECLLDHKGSVLTTPNEVPIYQMAKALRQDCTVALTGEGADEIFGGYAGPTFAAFDYDRSRGACGGVSQEALLRAYGRSRFNSRSEHFLIANTWFRGSEVSALFPTFSDRGGGLQAVSGWYDERFAELAELTTLDAYLHLHVRVNLEALLNRLDSSTMRASVEGRVPFTDHRVVEYLFQLPDRYKMGCRAGLEASEVRSKNAFELDQAGWVETKRLLRSAYASRVDAEILRRRKVSFPVPFIELFAGAESERLKDLLRSSTGLPALLAEGQSLVDVLGKASGKAPLLSWLLFNLALIENKWGVQV